MKNINFFIFFLILIIIFYLLSYYGYVPQNTDPINVTIIPYVPYAPPII